MRIAVYGAGGVGGYFGGLLARSGIEVHFIARGGHLEAIREGGLRVRSVAGDFELLDAAATDDPAEVGPCDWVWVCVKSHHTDEVGAALGPLLGEDTAVVSFQNGVDNEERLARHVGPERVVGGVALIFSTIAEPGVIEHTGGTTRILFGELDGRRSDRVTRLEEACRGAGIDVEVPPDVRQALWMKFSFILAHAGMTAAVRLPLGEIRSSPPAWEMFRRIVEEVVAVAAAEGVTLPEGVVDRQVALAAALEPESYSSLHFDLTHGKPMELEALHGTAVRLARKHGLAAPMCEAVHATLAPWAARNETGP